MKKVLSILLAVVLVLSLAACGGKDDPKPSGNSNSGDTPPASTQQEPTTPDPGTSQGETSQSGDPVGEWAKKYANFYGLAGLQAPEGYSTFEQGEFAAEGGFSTEQIDAFAQQVWDACMSVSADGIYQSKLADPATGAQEKGEEFAALSETKHSDSFMWNYSYNGEMYMVSIYFGSGDEIMLEVMRETTK